MAGRRLHADTRVFCTVKPPNRGLQWGKWPFAAAASNPTGAERGSQQSTLCPLLVEHNGGEAHLFSYNPAPRAVVHICSQGRWRELTLPPSALHATALPLALIQVTGEGRQMSISTLHFLRVLTQPLSIKKSLSCQGCRGATHHNAARGPYQHHWQASVIRLVGDSPQKQATGAHGSCPQLQRHTDCSLL